MYHLPRDVVSRPYLELAVARRFLEVRSRSYIPLWPILTNIHDLFAVYSRLQVLRSHARTFKSCTRYYPDKFCTHFPRARSPAANLQKKTFNTDIRKRMWTARGAEKFEGLHFSLKINTFPFKTSLRRLQTTFKHCKESILDIDERGREGGGRGASDNVSTGPAGWYYGSVLVYNVAFVKRLAM